MSNQMIQWSMLIVPWLTVFFMKRKDIKRYLPVALFATVLTIMIQDAGVTFGFWVIQETAFPFHQLMTYFFGTAPVLTLWVFKFTYGRFWVYMVANTILDIGYNFFLIDYLLPGRGIGGFFAITPLQGMLITLTHAIVIYGFQIWYEKMLVRAEDTNPSTNLQPAAAKPLDHDQHDNTNNK